MHWQRRINPNIRTRVNKPGRSSMLRTSNKRGRHKAGPSRNTLSRNTLSNNTLSRNTPSSNTLNSKCTGSRQTMPSSRALNRGGAMEEMFSARLSSEAQTSASGRNAAQTTGSPITAPGSSVADITDIGFPTTGSAATSGETIGSGLAASLSWLQADTRASSTTVIG